MAGKTYSFDNVERFVEHSIYIYMVAYTAKRYWLKPKEITFLVEYILVKNQTPHLTIDEADEKVSQRLNEGLDKAQNYRRVLFQKGWLSRQPDDTYEIPPMFNFQERGYRMEINVAYEHQNEPIKH